MTTGLVVPWSLGSGRRLWYVTGEEVLHGDSDGYLRLGPIILGIQTPAPG
jgi:hypothetical protein